MNDIINRKGLGEGSIQQTVAVIIGSALTALFIIVTFGIFINNIKINGQELIN